MKYSQVKKAYTLALTSLALFAVCYKGDKNQHKLIYPVYSKSVKEYTTYLFECGADHNTIHAIYNRCRDLSNTFK